MQFQNPVRSEIDFDIDGKQTGFLRLPHSVHRSAYGWLPIPIASIKNADGPAVLVMAGNHGDEYEGQILVSNLIRDIEPAMVTGQLILMPMANFPAATAGLRTSPLDDGNLNRSFPGSPTGTVTSIIANYIETQLLSRVQIAIDLHSGGSSLLYDGGNLMVLEPRDETERLRVQAYARGFGMSRTLMHTPNPVTIAAAARRQGAVSLITELGGAGTVSSSILRDATQGLLHFLGSIGLLHASRVLPDAPHRTEFMRTGPGHWTYAPERGLFEPLADLGAWVRSGEPAALLHFPDTPWQRPVEIKFEGSGQIVCKRASALVERGDCLFQLADSASDMS